MLETLKELGRILLKNDWDGQAEIIQCLINLHDTDQKEFVRLLHSIDMWGGSGAVWEVGDLGEDEVAFRYAIIRLAAQMDEAGLGTERNRYIASTFRKWNQAGI